MDRKCAIPFSEFPSSSAKDIRYFVSDVDDTITSKGKLLPLSLNALWNIKRAGLDTILVTGGSSGWADVYIRQWPVDYVIAESGALLLSISKDGDVLYKKNPTIVDEVDELREELLSKTKQYILSSDQYARIYDVAFDKKKNTPEDIDKIKEIALSLGASFTESSIHLNVWFGSYDKRNGLLLFLPDIYPGKEQEFFEKAVYFGDSYNDQPLFSLFNLSIGMHSVEDSRSDFDNLPTYITKGYGGYGFAEAVGKILKNK